MDEQMEEIVQILSKQSVGKLLGSLVVLLVGVLLTRMVLRMVRRVTERFHGVNPALLHMLQTALKWVLYTISVIVAAGTLGIPVTSFVALLSIVGLAVSLAVQGVLNNLAGGILLLSSKPFSPGDFVEVDEVSGTVRDIGFLHTRMESADGKMIFLPNNLMVTSRIINYSATGRRRVELNVSAAYGNAPEQVRAAVLDAIGVVEQRLNGANPSKAGCVLHEPAPQVLLECYGESAIEYTVRLWVNGADFMAVRYALNEALYDAFHRYGVEMTYPHLHIHMMDGGAPFAVPASSVDRG